MSSLRNRSDKKKLLPVVSKMKGAVLMRSIGMCRINGNGVDLYSLKDKKALLVHDVLGRISGISMEFDSMDSAVEWIEKTAGESSGAQRLNLVLGGLGVDGFPTTTA